MDAPCTDVPHLSTGSQTMTLDFAVLPSAWLGGDVAECDVFDVFADRARGQFLGRFANRAFSVVVAPHGSRFLILSNCSAV